MTLQGTTMHLFQCPAWLLFLDREQGRLDECVARELEEQLGPATIDCSPGQSFIFNVEELDI